MKLDSNHTSAMVSLLPNNGWWSKLEIPHLTLVFAGKIDQLQASQFNNMAKDAASIAMMQPRFSVKVIGTDVFGSNGDEEVDVFTLQKTPELMAMRRFLEKYNKSDYVEFKPHVTIGPAGGGIPQIPDIIIFDRINVAWGNEYMTFWLRKV